MSTKRVLLLCLCLSGAAGVYRPVAVTAQTHGQPEEFTATAIRSDEFRSGAGVVLMRVTRWSTDAERTRLIETLQKKGPDKLLDELSGMKSVGSIRTPDSLAYDLRYAYQSPGEDGGRQIILATDRPIGFWEATNRPRTIQYPFTVIQMQIDRDGHGKGTLSLATRITARGKHTIELENFSTSPVMLTDIKAEKK